MEYTRPEVTDLGSIAEHTYTWDFPGGTGVVICQKFPEQCDPR